LLSQACTCHDVGESLACHVGPTSCAHRVHTAHVGQQPFVLCVLCVPIVLSALLTEGRGDKGKPLSCDWDSKSKSTPVDGIHVCSKSSMLYRALACQHSTHVCPRWRAHALRWQPFCLPSPGQWELIEAGLVDVVPAGAELEADAPSVVCLQCKM
jgi:hypothetical protein